MRTEREIRVELESVRNVVRVIRMKIKQNPEDLENDMRLLRKAVAARNLLRWVLGEL